MCDTRLALSLTSMPKCGLAKPERVAVAIETCYQNVGVNIYTCIYYLFSKTRHSYNLNSFSYVQCQGK